MTTTTTPARVTWHGPVTGYVSTAMAVELPDPKSIPVEPIARAVGQLAAAIDALVEAERRRDDAAQDVRDAGYERDAAYIRARGNAVEVDIDDGALTAARATLSEAEQVAAFASQTMPNVYADARSAILAHGDDWRAAAKSETVGRIERLASGLYAVEVAAEALADELAVLEMLARSREVAPAYPWRPQLVDNGVAVAALDDLHQGISTVRNAVAGVRARVAAL